MIVLWPGGPLGIVLAVVCALFFFGGAHVHIDPRNLLIALLIGVVIWLCTKGK